MVTKYYSLKRTDDEKEFIVSGCFLDESTLNGKVVLTISLDEARSKLRAAKCRYHSLALNETAEDRRAVIHWAKVVSSIERHEASFGYEFEKYQLIVSEYPTDGSGYKNTWIYPITKPGTYQYPINGGWVEPGLRYKSNTPVITVVNIGMTMTFTRIPWDDNPQMVIKELISHINLATGEEESSQLGRAIDSEGDLDES
jgi:hypothetical protein